MIEQLETFKGNTLAFEVIDGFTETDEKLAQKFFQEKLDMGFSFVNVLIKLDEMKISKTSSKAFMEDIIWTLRNYKQMGHLAIVAHSNILKALVPIDNLFFERASKERYERYFDVSQMEEAMKFVKSTL
ncbi:STAS/SEC14 domain-containing protein [Flavobacterium sp. NRK F10]|uniref:STAS/SEC14 domain-containing protein n=1 Tax=Flavobacterium sediminis TaxID=2201181 RepID=A0A2U8QWI9_9FLAO|nr:MULTISPECIES: STAS/SEC14 domain-containing protein [Flavobacterium]AWM14567.1 STAS/SEC14 domain-containing protein [Flavobacterium sediminis]MCO6175810.1 STAS/SEC14 domain-containing protein [Flavobacterium sp. NRK F10]